MQREGVMKTGAIGMTFLGVLVGLPAGAQEQRFTGTLCGAKHEVEIKAAPQGVDAKLAAYLGVWTGGAWRGGDCNALIVKEVRLDGTATVRYIFTPYPEIPQGYFEKQDAKLDKDGRLAFTSAKGAYIWYKLQPDNNTLEGDFQTKDGQYQFKFKDFPRRQKL